MLTRYWIEMKYGFVTLAVLAGLLALDQTQAFSGLNTLITEFFDLMIDLGFVGIFIVAVIGNGSLLVHIPYTVPLLSLALSGANLDRMLLMGVASGLGAVVGEIISYSITLKLLGDNPTLGKSPLLKWVRRMVHSHPRLVPLLLFVYAVTPLPDDTVIIPLAMVRYSIKRISLSLLPGKIIHNLLIAAGAHYSTSWSANRVSASVQVDMALGILILLVMLILYQVAKARTHLTSL